MFLWKCRNFLHRKCLDRRGLEPSTFGFIPNAQTIWAFRAWHMLSHVFEYWLWWYSFFVLCCKVNIWKLNCARARKDTLTHTRARTRTHTHTHMYGERWFTLLSSTSRSFWDLQQGHVVLQTTEILKVRYTLTYLSYILCTAILLLKYCYKWGLVVDIAKTKAMVLSKQKYIPEWLTCGSVLLKAPQLFWIIWVSLHHIMVNSVI